MAFPLSIPAAHKIAQISFDIVGEYSLDVARSGHSTAGRLAPAYWYARVQTTNMDAAQIGEWRGFLDSLDGSIYPFYLHDVFRKYPLAYADAGFAGLTRYGGGAFDGTTDFGTVLAGRDGFTVGAVTHLPVGFVVSVGDYVALSWMVSGAPRRSLHRVTEAAVGGVGGTAALKVKPRLIAQVPGSGDATFLKPPGIFRVTPGTQPDFSVNFDRTGRLSFEAIQVLYRT
jgi:hypothetical protein